ncbi:MAG: PDZ domain-containing protein [Acidobacteriota bacterium]|nr:PDZ domain-containing protein [Acidobacteriota bacterium]
MNRQLASALLLAFAAAFVPQHAARAAGLGSSSNHAPQGYLGIDLRDIPDDQISAMKLHDGHGAEIILVDHDAPAGKAGLREHDVVLQMDGQTVLSQDHARRILHECAPGHTMVLLISRDGQVLSFSARMSTRDEVERRAWEQHIPVPEPPDTTSSEPAVAVEPGSTLSASPTPTPHEGNSFMGTLVMSPSYTGARLEQLSSQLAQFFGVPSGNGLLVRSVADNSPAAEAGMRAGDVVVRANDHPITSTAEWSKTLRSSRGRPLAITVLRDKKQQTLMLTPDGKRRSAVEEQMQGQERPVLAHVNVAWPPRR